jgi:Ca2+-binding RTX toxin-like protein
LRDIGMQIAMDNYGTGYSSLAYLRNFPFYKIKIDRSFVRDMLVRKDCQALIRAVVVLARSLRIKTVIEGRGDKDVITAGDEDDVIVGGWGDDNLAGGGGNDLIMGRNGNDTLLGGEGNDTLWGGVGSDSVDGGNGDDVLGGILGAPNTLMGGAGHDTFWVRTLEKNPTNDFNSAEDTLKTARTKMQGKIEAA